MPALIRIALAGLALPMAAAAPPALAADAPCPASAQPPALAIKPFDVPLQYHFDYDEQGMLGFRMQAGGDRQVPAHWHLHGLTTAFLGASFQYSFSRQRVGKSWCMAPTAVTVQVGFTGMNIFVDKQYPSATCQRRAVLIHEAKHVAINYEEMNSGIPAMEAELRAAYGAGHFPVRVAEPAEGEKYIGDYFRYYTMRGFDRIKASIAARNLALDNPQEYANIGALCPKW